MSNFLLTCIKHTCRHNCNNKMPKELAFKYNLQVVIECYFKSINKCNL